MKRILISGVKSGSGKTTVTCGILKALIDRGYDVSSFKCGPDYIDPMFHTSVIGAYSRNLDSFFCDTPTLKHVIKKNAKDISVIEGVMGYFDGAGVAGSSMDIAVKTETPAVIVIDCKGMAASIGAVICGFLEFQKPNNICGFIFNRLPESLVPDVKKMCDTFHTEYLGRFPTANECMIESRHLGLVTSDEIDNLKEKVSRLAGICEDNIDIDRMLEIASEAPDIDDDEISIERVTDENVRIAVAKDKAFCFHYEDNYDILRSIGCEIVTFSPLNDEKLPEDINGIILNGGYPELYASELSANKSMLKSIHDAVKSGVPTIAECGGFMYLHNKLEGNDGVKYSMASVIDGEAFKTGKLVRFGYINMKAEKDNMLVKQGETIRAHEFHYWDSTCTGESFLATKPGRNISYRCINGSDTLYAGFPHLYFYGNIKMAERFVTCCEKAGKYGQNRQYKNA